MPQPKISIGRDGFIYRGDRLKPRPDPATLPEDASGRKIALFIHRHPRIASWFGSIDLGLLSEPEKMEILSRIRSILNITTFTRSDLGYVGP